VKEQVREQWNGNGFRSVLSDGRYGLRQLCKNPAFTVVAVLTLALGIGANTAIFCVIDAVVLRPLPFHDPGRLVAVRSIDLKDATQGGDTSYPAFLDWRSQSHSFEAMSVWNVTNLTYTGGDQPESIRSAVVSANLFSLLGVSPALGRPFGLEEDRPGGDHLPVVLSCEFWQTHFGGDPNVLGGPSLWTTPNTPLRESCLRAFSFRCRKIAWSFGLPLPMISRARRLWLRNAASPTSGSSLVSSRISKFPWRNPTSWRFRSG